jgi:regulatory protein
MKKKIKLRKKSSTLFLVLEDNDPWGILPVKILHFFSLQPEVETEINNEIQQKLVLEINKFAWNRLLHYLSFRERSIHEARGYLLQLPLRSDLAEQMISKAISYNYINEKRFCELYITDLQNKSKSRKEIIEKLRTKGVSRAMINESLEEHFNNEREVEAIKILYRKAETKYRADSKIKQKQKILNYLTRKGFSYWQVKETMEKE